MYAPQCDYVCIIKFDPALPYSALMYALQYAYVFALCFALIDVTKYKPTVRAYITNVAP